MEVELAKKTTAFKEAPDTSDFLLSLLPEIER